jgi:hypothetical protein
MSLRQGQTPLQPQYERVVVCFMARILPEGVDTEVAEVSSNVW